MFHRGVTDLNSEQLRVALVAPPYYEVPPKDYGGTEMHIADLANSLVARGHNVVVLGAGRSHYERALCCGFR